MLVSLARKVFGSKNEREIKKLDGLVAEVASWEPKIKPLSDDELVGKTAEFQDRIAKGETLDGLLPEAFAVAREAAIRVLGMRPYDVQVLGGIVLHNGCIAEMKTGEGKTLTATMPVYLNALSGKGVFVVTVNDYLAKRDAEWMGRVYRFLGLTVGTILHEKNDRERKEAYACDITYGTNNEFGFDYLRDNMKHNSEQLAQRGFNYAIVDEVDSVLIDEARTPLIISGPAEESTSKYYDANEAVLRLNPDVDYTVDEKDHHALLTDEGIHHAEKLLKVSNLYDVGNVEVLHCLEQSLKAHFLFKKDVDYLVEDEQVIIIDQSTGRKMPGRRYSEGLHQGLEAKEGVKIEKQNQTLASVTFQNFFRMFDKLAGMTGTAETEAAEFLNIYKLEVMVVPTNRPLARKDMNDQVYGTYQDKLDAIIDEIKTQSNSGRPVLVGTIAIESSELLSNHLRKAGVKHVVLNAKYHASEADIVAQAGRKGAVTIATNMAGRGTDILLGGNPDALTNEELMNNPEADRDALFEKYKVQCEAEKQEVLSLGGLCIIGTERHESRRIDNQLRGRAGRQGDPGSSQFFISLEDKLMRLFGNEKMKKVLAANMEEGVPIQHKMVNKAIQKAQKAVEAQHFEIRKRTVDYDDVMNKQRTTFYKMRHELLREDPREFFFQRMAAIADYFFNEYAASARRDEEDKKRLEESLHNLLISKPNFEETSDVDALKESLVGEVRELYAQKWDVLEMPEEAIREHERFIMLYVIDQQWKDHMRNMDFLREGISLQGYAQKDPLIEYKKASFEMFNGLMDRLDEEVVKTLVHVQPRISDQAVDRMKAQRAREEKAMKMAGKEAEEARPRTVRRDKPKIGRNAPCPCGSGKKYKQCCGRN